MKFGFLSQCQKREAFFTSYTRASRHLISPSTPKRGYSRKTAVEYSSAGFQDFQQQVQGFDCLKEKKNPF